MKTTVSLLALAAALACAAPAFAAGPYNEAQARQKMEGAGYSKLSGLHQNDAGEWAGQGDRDGRVVTVVLDGKGAVTQTAQNDAVQAGTADLKVIQPPAQVTVKQAQPDVTVTEAQPTVTVHQPAPIVTVEIPQPEITVHMPKPIVSVSQAQPQVEVTQPKPQVQVMAAPRAQVSVQRSAAEVDMRQSGQAPQIQYSADQAKVSVKQAAGAPSVKVVQDGDDGASNAAAAPAVRPQMASAGKADTASAPVSKLTGMNVTNLHGDVHGDVLGDVEQVVKRKADGRDYAVIGHGGFLGIGQKHVALPLDKMAMRDGKLEMRGLTDDEIRSMKPFNDNDAGHTQIDGNQTVSVSNAS